MTEAELIFCEIFHCSKPSLYLDKNRIPGKDKSALVSSILKRRILGEPLPYILGKTEFMGLEFKVTPDVLIPRQETEILVETAVSQLGDRSPELGVLKILEIGTGSGCIAISLAKLLGNVHIIATDISEKALKIAYRNSQLNKVSDKISFIQSDLFASCDLRPATYGLIISNPPYVNTHEIDNLQPEIKYEPRIALDGGGDGLDFYRRIASQAPEYLKEDGLLILEMGFGQAESIKNILKISENFEIIEVVKDYNNIERVVVAQKRIIKNG